MSRSQKPRRKYDPNKWLRRTIANHGARVEASPLTDSQQRDLGLAYHLSFQQMLNGGNEAAWHSLAATLNVCLILCERGFGAEFEPEIKAGMRALMRTKYRQQETGSWALNGNGITAIRRVLEIHDAQIEIAERGEIRAAINEVYARVMAGDIYAEAA